MTGWIRMTLGGVTAAVLSGGAAVAQTPGTMPAMPSATSLREVLPPQLFRTGGSDAPAAMPPAGTLPHTVDGHANGHGAAPAHGGHGGNGHGEYHGGDILPPPHEEHGHDAGGAFVSAEYLLLRARRADADIALVDPTRDLTPGGRLEGLDYSLRSGVRGRIGYAIPHSGYDVLAGYTYLRATSSRTLAAPAGGTLYPALTRPGLTDEAQSAVTDGSIQYHVYDIELGKRLHASEHATARIFGAGRFVSVRQDLSNTFNGGNAAGANVRSRTNFDGFGPALGLEGTVTIYHGFHAYARGSTGLLTGTAKASVLETNNGGATTFANIESSTRRVVPTAGVAIGGGWQYARVSVRVGYEITHYFGVTETLRLTSDFAEGKTHRQLGDLSLEGLFAQFGLSF
jgi:Legionella pneumophila major outer membrane protein precursor